jgi:hypothetical protein
MAGLHKAKGTKKQRKVGRNAAYCLRYRNENRCEKNQIKRLTKHLVKFVGDNCAKTALDKCKIAVSGRK